MTTQTASRSVDFYFENMNDSYTGESYRLISKKLTRLINNWEGAASIHWLETRDSHVSALLMFEYSNGDDKGVRKLLDKNLQRVIDSHKQSATYGWPVQITNGKAGN